MDGVNWPTAANVHPGAEEEAVGATSAGKPVNAVREGWFVLSNRPRRVATRVNLVPGRAGMRFLVFSGGNTKSKEDVYAGSTFDQARS